MSAKVLIPIVVIFSVLIGVAVGVPIFEAESTESAFEIRDQSLRAGYFTWRDFNIPKGGTISIHFACNREVTAYLFTENQYTNFQNVGEDVCLESIKQVESGNIKIDIQTTGMYYFVLTNRGERSVQIA